MPPHSPDSGVLGTMANTLYRLVYDDAWSTLALFSLAAVLGLGSLVVFFLSPSLEATRFELLLQVAAAAVLFYMALTYGQE